MRSAVTAMVLACAAGAAGCASPEATRTRGGGAGADPGNRPAVVRLHEGSRQYWNTPGLIPGEPMPLDAAEQARQLSLLEGDAAAPPEEPEEEQEEQDEAGGVNR